HPGGLPGPPAAGEPPPRRRLGGGQLARGVRGRGLGLDGWLIFEEEYWRAGAPGRVGQNGIFLFAPTVFEFGTEEQKRRVLPPVARGEKVWAQGWSEPGAGSDLAALRSHTERTDGGWLLTGQKTWS